MNPLNEFLHDVPTILLTPALLVLLFLMIVFGTRSGKRRIKISNEAEKDQVAALRSSLMGLLALIVGFSFSLALGRFDDRSIALVTEANAIGTAWLRTDLLDGPDRDALRSALADYAQSRLSESHINLTQETARENELEKSAAAFKSAWAIATEAARKTPNPATVAVVTALNDVIDSQSSYEASLKRYVPGGVLFLLLLTLLFLGWVVGYCAGEEGGSPPIPMWLMLVLIVLLLALILDLDRPRRGIMVVDQTPMITAITNILVEAGRIPAGSN